MKKIICALAVISCYFNFSMAQNDSLQYFYYADGMRHYWITDSTSINIIVQQSEHYDQIVDNLSNIFSDSSDIVIHTSYKKSSVGVSAFCSFVGVSLKFNLRNNLYLQTDIGGDAYLNFLFIPQSPTLRADFGAQFYLLYEDKFPKRTNTYWIVGGGLNFAGVPHIPYSKQISLKSGAKALLGIEYIPENTPISIQFDSRIGYGIMYSTKGVKPWERNGYLSDNNPYHFFDYGFVFTLRFHFGKKN